MVAYICDRIDNDGCMIIVAEIVGQGASQRRGTFGIDEPMLATVPSFPRPPVRSKFGNRHQIALWSPRPRDRPVSHNVVPPGL